MYAGALDERFKAVVPVCSVGNYQAYLQAACCVCEVLPGALRFTEEGDVLGLVAPRALMVINATKDAFQFSVGEAKKSLERARAIFKLYDAADKADARHLRVAARLQPADARGDVRLDDALAQGRGRRQADPGAETRGRKSRGFGLLRGGQAAGGVRVPLHLRRPRGEAAAGGVRRPCARPQGGVGGDGGDAARRTCGRRCSAGSRSRRQAGRERWHGPPHDRRWRNRRLALDPDTGTGPARCHSAATAGRE